MTRGYLRKTTLYLTQHNFKKIYSIILLKLHGEVSYTDMTGQLLLLSNAIAQKHNLEFINSIKTKLLNYH